MSFRKHQTKRITYLYAADGRKLKETITDGAMTHTFDYCSNLVYEDGELSYLLTPGGRAIPTEQEHEYVYEYFLKDHLGNVRVVFGDPDHVNEAEVIQENHYYPFGMTLGGLNYIAGLENRYLYQGKEITGDFGLWWQDFHARRFDSQLGRWHVTDPVIQFASPYIGMGNDPIVFTDPTGMFPTWWNSMDFWLLLNCNLKEVNITADRPEGSNPFGFQEFSGLGGQINSTFGIGSGNSSNSGSGCGGVDGATNTGFLSPAQTISAPITYAGITVEAARAIAKMPNIGYNIAYNNTLLKSVNYLKPASNLTFGLGILTDATLSILINPETGEPIQSVGETTANTAISITATIIGGWAGVGIQLNYQASKSYMDMIIKHPEWSPYPIRGYNH